MSLRSKIVLILFAVVGAYALFTSQIQRSIFSNRFALLEERAATQDVERVVAAIRDEIDDVDRIAREWAAWDDAYAFVRGERRQAFERSCLNPKRLADQGIDLLFFLEEEDAHGDHPILWASCVDPQTRTELNLRELNSNWEKVAAGNPLLARSAWHRAAGSAGDAPRPVGILLTDYAPLIVSGRPIVRSDGSGKPAGMLLLGRFLAEDLDERLTDQTLVDFDFWQADGRHEMPADATDIYPRVSASAAPIVRIASDEMIHAWAAFPDILERPKLLLRANVKRDVSAIGSTALRFGLYSSLAGGFVLLLALMFLLQHIVIAPLSRLTRHALRIGETEDFRAKLDLKRDDELGTLAKEFNSMMTKLEQARAQVIDTARTAGMSEIATGILHNIGNVLNSVNISASMISQQIDKMSVADLKRVAEILEEHKDDLGAFLDGDPKGRHVQPFICALSTQLDEEQRSILSELGSLTSGIEHICELIKSQQEFAVQAELVEPVDLAAKLDEALHITEQACGKDPDLRVTREYEELPEIEVDKRRLLEILVNLIQNARQAMAGRERRELTLRLHRSGDERLTIEVSDTGTGIPQDALAKVFNLGFTTKPDGHGYGLHTAANAATEMGGSLTATSPGPDEGATFVLELPLRRAAQLGASQ